VKKYLGDTSTRIRIETNVAVVIQHPFDLRYDSIRKRIETFHIPPEV
jgi:hypothetical protein